MLAAVNKRWVVLPIWVKLLALFCAGVCVRALLAFRFASSLFVWRDESIYFNLARSLWTTGKIAYRGQPIHYDSLLYPILLAPLFSLQQYVNIHKVIQLFNCLAMNAAVFPVWFLAYELSQSKRIAWVMAVFALILPDFLMTGIMMTESVVYPLLMGTFYILHKAISTRKPYLFIIAGFCGFLLYFTKPGLIAVGVSAIVVLVLYFFEVRDKKLLFSVFLMAITMGLLIAASKWACRFTLDVDYSYTSMYQEQALPFSIGNVLKALNGFLLYLFYFPVSCFVFPMVIAIAHIKRLRIEQRYLLWMTCLSMLILLLGTSYLVYLNELSPGTVYVTRIHLRYVAGLVPLFLMFGMSPEVRKCRMNAPLAAMLFFLLASLIVFTFHSLEPNVRAITDSPTLSFLILSPLYINMDIKKISQLFCIMGILTGGYYISQNGWTKRMQTVVYAALMGYYLLCNVPFYASGNTKGVSPALTIKYDARDVSAMLEAEKTVAVTQDGGYKSTYMHYLDLYSRTPVSMVEITDLLSHTTPDGVYQPFVPDSYQMTNPDHPTPEAQALIIDRTMNKFIQYTKQNQYYTMSNSYALVPLEEGKPWIKSALVLHNPLDVDYDLMDQTQGATLYIYDPTLRAKPRIHLYLVTQGINDDDILTLRCGEWVEEIAMNNSASPEWYGVYIPTEDMPSPIIIEISSTSNTRIIEYHLD